MRRALAAAAAAASLLAGCGGSAGDLMSITVSGVGPRHELVITADGRGSCDRGPDRTLQSADVLTARDVARRMKKLAASAAAFPAGGRAFVASTKDGTVRWSESYRSLPAPLPEAELLTLKLTPQLCGSR
jgi:hypothetical protein